MAEVGSVMVTLSAQDNLSGPMGRAADRTERLGKRMQSTGKRMSSVGMTATKRVSGPIAAMGAAVLATGVKFEKSMNRVQAVSGATGKQMSELQGLARELGSTTQFSASQAGDAMGFLAQAGFEANEMMSALPGTLDLAAAGQLELARAADIASNVMTGFGMEADEIGRVNDTLAATASSANTNVSQLGQSMSLIAPVAKSSGMSVEETSAAIGLLGDAGIQGTRAGTSLRGILASLEAPSAKAASAIEDMGLQTHDAQGEMLPLVDIVSQLEEEGLSSAQAMEIFGREAGPGMAALVSQGSDALGQMVTDLENSNGRAKEMADTQMQGLTGALARMKSALEGVAIAIAESGLIDWAASLGEKIANLLQGLSETNPAMLKAGVIVAGVVAAAGPLVAVLGAVVTGLGAVLSPVGAVVAILATLAAAITTAYVKSETFRDVVNGAFETVRDVVGPIIGWLGDRLGELFGWLSGKLGDVAEWFGLTSTSVTDDVREMGNKTVAEFTEMHQKAKDQLTQLGNSGRTISSNLADDIIADSRRMKREAVKALDEQHTQQVTAMQELATELESISNEQATSVVVDMTRQKQQSVAEANEQHAKVKRELAKLAESGERITRGMVDGILEDMRRQRDGAISAVVKQENQITNILTRLEAESGQISVAMASDAIQQSAKRRDKTIATAREEYRGRIDQINKLHRESDAFTTQMRDDAVEDARQQRDQTISAARENHEGVVAEIRGMRKGVVDEVSLQTGEVRSGFEKMGRAMLEHIVTSSLNVIGEFASMGMSAGAEVRSMGETVGREVRSMGETIGEDVASMGRTVGSHFQDMATSAIEEGLRIVTWFASLGQTIINATGDLGGALVQAGKDLIGGLASGVRSAVGSLASALESAVNSAASHIPFVDAKGDGPGFGMVPGGGDAMARAQKAMQGLPLSVTSTYRTPAENAAAGGSPTSYHLDKSNPAVDFAGPTWAMDIAAARLRQMDNRELLWRTAGHFDHVHVAHEGGNVTPYGMEPLRGDELYAKLQVGETVLPKGHDGSSAGGDRRIEVNVYNPAPESAEESLSRQMRRLESVGVLG